jgi:hypothetical protein
MLVFIPRHCVTGSNPHSLQGKVALSLAVAGEEGEGGGRRKRRRRKNVVPWRSLAWYREVSSPRKSTCHVEFRLQNTPPSPMLSLTQILAPFFPFHFLDGNIKRARVQRQVN